MRRRQDFVRNTHLTILSAEQDTPMNTKLETNQQHEPLRAPVCLECPLHLAMEEIANTAVTQHVLHLEGECQPRPELLRQLEAWSALHTLIRTHVCVASREATIAFEELERALDALSDGMDIANSPRWQLLRAGLVACARATSCPLGTAPDELGPRAE